MNVTEYLHRRLKLQQRLLVLKYFLYFLQQIVDDFLRQIDERHIFRVLPFIIYNFVVQIVDNDVHDEFNLVRHISF